MLKEYEGTVGGFRLGYAEWDYHRPFSTNVISIDGNPVIYDAHPVIRSIVFVFEPLDEGSPGIKLDGTLNLGIDNVVRSSLDWNQVIEFKQENTQER